MMSLPSLTATAENLASPKRSKKDEPRTHQQWIPCNNFSNHSSSPFLRQLAGRRRNKEKGVEEALSWDQEVEQGLIDRILLREVGDMRRKREALKIPQKFEARND